MQRTTKLVAATMSLSLLGGTAVAASESASIETISGRGAQTAEAAGPSLASSNPSHVSTLSQPTVDKSSNAAAAARRRNRVALRTVKPCVFRRQVTRCVIDVRRLEQRRNRVVAIGTITPRSNPAVHVPFKKRVVGVRTADGVLTAGGFGFQQVPAPSCAILGLVLGPLHLDVLGLVVDLNRVVLNITGQTGAGNLLGNLLCALTGILDGGLILPRLLSVVSELLAAINAVLRL